MCLQAWASAVMGESLKGWWRRLDSRGAGTRGSLSGIGSFLPLELLEKDLSSINWLVYLC